MASKVPARTRPKAKTSVRRPAGARDRAMLAVERLAHEYPGAVCALVHTSPFELLVATILSAQTTDERVNMVTLKLFRRYPTPEVLAGAKQEDVENIIRSAGFFRAKSTAIIAMARDVVERYGGEVPSRMEDLVTLHGVGRKTANVVLGVGFGVPGFPVDTHVMRLTRLLKLTRHADPVDIESDIGGMVPENEWTNFSLRLIQHGRRVCIAQRPQCPECVMNDFCPSALI